jgi:hypothetical protein
MRLLTQMTVHIVGKECANGLDRAKQAISGGNGLQGSAKKMVDLIGLECVQFDALYWGWAYIGKV